MLKGEKKGDFIRISLSLGYLYELIDTKTGIRYIGETGGGVAARLNPDGTPMIITPEEMEGIDVKVKD
jgi:hypothetical protein